jgi:hypothetical protein
MSPTIEREQARRANKDTWNESMERLQSALAVPAPGREREWAETVNNAVAVVERALRQHHAIGRDANGLFAEVDETRPTLAREAMEVRQDHDVLLERCLALREEVRRALEAFTVTPNALNQGDADPRPTPVVGVPDFGAIRRQAQELLELMLATRQAEAKLVLESVNHDIGVGD